MLFSKLLRVQTSLVHVETAADMVLLKSVKSAAFSLPLCKRTPSVVSLRWLSSCSSSSSDTNSHVVKPTHFERKGNVQAVGKRYAEKVPSKANIPFCFRTITFSPDTSYSCTPVIFRQLHSSKSISQVSHTQQSFLTARPLTSTFIGQKKYFGKKPHEVSTHQSKSSSSARSFCSKGDSGPTTTTGKDSPGGGNSGECKSPITSIPVKDGLQTRAAADDFLSHLTDDQKNLLYHSLNIDVLRDKYEGHLGSSKSESHQFLSRFGRPTAAVGTEDPTGTLCEVSPKWLHARLDEKSPPPGAAALWAVGVKNALPFIGFGFLDNLIMILAGDYIDITIGTSLGISTMAAAALGNTISDVAGIGSAWYIEDFASKVGIKDPVLTPSQMASKGVRWASNGGRAIGVVIGCLLGMIPLAFLPSAEEDKEKHGKKGKPQDPSKETP